MAFAINEEEMLHRRVRRRRRRLVYYLMRMRAESGETGPLNCRLNTGVPVLQRFFAGDDPREDFRLSRESLAVLLDLLHQEQRHGWGATIETLVLLFWLASGASYRVVSRVVIYLPRSAEDLAAVTRGFAGLARHCAFLKAPSAINGCHGTPAQPTVQQNVYPPPGHFILADSGYPCLQHPLPLITPYRLPVRGVAAQHFNGHHARARSVIERAFGMMKTRFRAIFLKALEIRHTFLPQVITACAVLHNICLGAGDTMAPEEDVQDGMLGDEAEDRLEAVSGARWRDRLSAEVSALEEVDHNHVYLHGSRRTSPANPDDVEDSGDVQPKHPDHPHDVPLPVDIRVSIVVSHPAQQHCQRLLLSLEKRRHHDRAGNSPNVLSFLSSVYTVVPV
ncbi:protein ALP1-like [Xyrichtys novacula]|uniref:Protein ALP1-like n=1 Tax=Xyrichtys novacula TaxID=13765 RepID=A0AAV1H5A2_XYRNO|nr:protein ALP1-like [Xyrichtys novacula]